MLGWVTLSLASWVGRVDKNFNDRMEDTMNSRKKLLALASKHGSDYCVNAIERYVFWREQWAAREAARRAKRAKAAKLMKTAGVKKAETKKKKTA
jgi:hypothetical protein